MTLPVTLSNVGHLNNHSRSYHRFQHRTAKVLFLLTSKQEYINDFVK